MLAGKCYTIIEEEKTQTESEITCNLLEATLAKPKSFLESEFLESLVSHFNQQRTNNGSTAMNKVWIDARQTTPDDDTFLNFKAGICNCLMYCYDFSISTSIRSYKFGS